YFDVMGLRPALGRLLGPRDDGPKAEAAAVLTYRFWNTQLDRNPSVVGKKIRLGSRVVTVVGVLEPCVPYPADTEIIANIATSPHHLGATMVTRRTHRMTELFGRLARSVRRESELAVRAALGAGAGALRRTLLAESLVLCGTGAVLGVLLARPMVTLVGRFAARFSVRGLEVAVDPSLLWVGAALAMAAAVALAYVPRLPSPHAPNGLGLAAGGLRITAGTNRRLRAFAITQIALSFVLLAAAGVILSSLASLQAARTGYDLRQVLAIDVPLPLESFGPKAIAFYEEAMRRIEKLPGVERVAAGNFVPWRDAGTFGAGFQFTGDGYTPANGEENPHGRLRNVTPGFFAALGVPILAGRDFTAQDRAGGERVVIISQSVAERLYPGGEALNHRVWWTDPYFGTPTPLRVVGVVAD